METLAVGTPFVLYTVFGHEKPKGREIEDLATIYSRGGNILQGCSTLRAGGNPIDNDFIRIRDRFKCVAFVPLLTAGRTLTFLSGCLGSPKTVHGGGTTAVPTVLVHLGLEFGNASLQVSVLITEFCDETLLFRDDALEIIDDCKKSRDICHSVLGKRTFFNTHPRGRNISSH
jgi:hypothetical protein